MAADRAILIFFFIFGCAIYLAWILKEALVFFKSLLFDENFNWKKLILLILATILVFVSDRILPDRLDIYFTSATNLAIALFFLAEIKDMMRSKNTMGVLLFKSRRIANPTYVSIILIPFVMWMIYNDLHAILDDSTTLFIAKNWGVEIDTYTYSLSEIGLILLFAVYFAVYLWHQLEIREKGIYYSDNYSPIYWDKIVDFIWTQNNSLLEIICLNSENKEIKLKIEVADGEKNTIDKIIRDNCKLS